MSTQFSAKADCGNFIKVQPAERFSQSVASTGWIRNTKPPFNVDARIQLPILRD
jgi:hypothetical protein